jgi:type II secretory pathway component PulF
MSNFQYKALAADGKITEGTLEAGGRQDALRLLQGRGLRPIRLGEGTAQARAADKKSAEVASEALVRKKIAFKTLENFTRQLSSLLAAGVPLARALQILSRESSNKAAQAKWKTIHNLVIDGLPLADAMGRLPETFPRVYVAMVQAGETGGFLDLVLSQIADFQARDKELRGKVKAAMIYPCVLLFLAVCVVIFLMTFFIPRFTKLFQGLGGQLPWITQMVVAASHVCVHYGPVVAAGVALAVYAIRQWLKSDQGRRQWERMMLGAPVIGPLTARFAMTRFCRMLGTLAKSGVALITALRVARESLGNQTLVDALNNSIERVKQGDALAASLSDCPQLFPGSVVEMISIAEETGRLDQELIRLADVTEGEMDGQMRAAVALAEPLLLLCIAAFIGTIFISMVLPIFSIQDMIK